jgi:hypothetical protein
METSLQGGFGGADRLWDGLMWEVAGKQPVGGEERENGFAVLTVK